jgi:hypothetical protein
MSAELGIFALAAIKRAEVERDALLRERETAMKWYRDHVTDDGIYDEAMWGDPFAISPQLRAALAAGSPENT